MTLSTVGALTGVTKTFDGRKVLDDFHFSVEDGEMVALTGPSGSGKSTVLNLLGLLAAPDSGQIHLLGDRAPRPRSRAATRALRWNLGYLFQNFALIDAATVQQNLDVALAYSTSRAPRRVQVEDALEQVGLAGFANRRVHSLSGGEQQRVAIARLLLKPCSLILADEPTGSLDADNRDVVLSLLLALQRGGKTLVIATHDEVVASSCTRRVVLGEADRCN